MKHSDLPKCKCGAQISLSFHGGRHWCPDCLWKRTKRLPVKRVLAACAIIEEADRLAMHVDGNVPPTAAMLDAEQIQECLSALWACKKPLEKIGHA